MLFLIYPAFGTSSYNLSTSLFVEYLSNSMIITCATGILTLILGLMPAMLVAFYDFPGRKFVQYTTILPLAIPVYISALSYNYLIDYTPLLKGLIYSTIPFSVGKKWANLICQIFVMSFSYYPYLYIICMPKLCMIKPYMAISSSMGYSTSQSILKIALPLSKSAIITGTALIMMEVISDFGSTQIFGINTFTTGIYRSWFLLEDYNLAAKLILSLLFIVMMIFIVEKVNCDKKNFANNSSIDKIGYDHETKLAGAKGYLALIIALCIPFIGFLIPIIPLIKILLVEDISINTKITGSIFNTVFISTITALLIIIITLKLSYITRQRKKLVHPVRLLTVGYAIPSIVLAFGVMTFLSHLSGLMNYLSELLIDYNPRIIMMGSIGALMFTYTFRFIGISIGTIDPALEKVPAEYDWLAEIIGKNKLKSFVSIYIPLIWKSICVSFMLLFIDISKELAATLIIRPFNFDTMSTKMFDLISEEQFVEAVPLATMTILISLASVIYVSRQIYKNKKEEQSCPKINIEG
ncbi:iron ABC transporter permease [Anaplasmataceae bacterium AB001_6]|nr:iron ABC transporter permease [Anaplasmataceae bacterium AB001_6]